MLAQDHQRRHSFNFQVIAMQAKEVGKMLAGSVAIYMIMAACSAAGGPQAFLSGDADASGSSGGTKGDGSGGVLDALTDPISEASADPSQSGTRLKLKYYAGADGSKLSAGLHDSQLNVDCYYSYPMSDGTLRCVPNEGLYLSVDGRIAWSRRMTVYSCSLR